MKAIHVLAACVLTAVPTVGFAQGGDVVSKTPPAKTTPGKTMAVAELKIVPAQGADQVLASKIVGAEVFSPTNEKIGKIEYLVMSKDGRVDAAVVGVGGFLGIDRKDVALSFSSLNVHYGPENAVRRITADVTKDGLKSAPDFHYLERKS